jgi:hypothetical protein
VCHKICQSQRAAQPVSLETGLSLTDTISGLDGFGRVWNAVDSKFGSTADRDVQHGADQAINRRFRPPHFSGAVCGWLCSDVLNEVPFI